MAELDPYKAVWDKVEDHESEIQKAMNNGVLFEPSYEELGKRSASTARYFLRQARKLGPTVDGRAAFDEAMFHRNLAAAMFEKRDEINRKSR